MLSLAVYYSVYQSQMVGTFDPKGDLAAYEAMVEKQPNLKCDCQRQSIPFREFATPTVDINAACEWVKADLQADISTCRELDLSGYCASVRDACEQSDSFISWIMDEFNNSIVSSPVLIHDKALAYSTTASFESNFKIGELVAAAPKVTVKAWAAANMPRIMRVIGDVTTRVKAQAKKVNYLYDNDDDEFARTCASSTPIICRGSSSNDDDYALRNGGAAPVNCTRADTTPSCDITKVADGTCDPECMSPECLFDGGDCANNEIAKSYPRDLRQTFTLLDARLSPDTGDDDYSTSWLDRTPDAFIDSTRRRCDDAQSWTKTETILEDVDMYSSNFGGFDFSSLARLIDVPKSNSKYPRAANGDKVEFCTSVSLGCDNTNGGTCQASASYDSGSGSGSGSMPQYPPPPSSPSPPFPPHDSPSAPTEWTCSLAYYGSSDGCDCACGAWDPDCDGAYGAALYGCSGDDDVCVNTNGGTCQGSKRRRLQASEDYDGEDFFRNYLDPEKDLYTRSGFAFLENFAAPLMGKHTNLETAIDNLFVDKRDLEVDYEKYFTACKVSSCTFTYMSASSLAGVTAGIIGLLGGINNAMNATFKVVYAVMRTTIVKKTKIKMTEGNAMETPATYEGAQPSKTPNKSE